MLEAGTLYLLMKTKAFGWVHLGNYIGSRQTVNIGRSGSLSIKEIIMIARVYLWIKIPIYGLH
jgi:hypothetical protein